MEIRPGKAKAELGEQMLGLLLSLCVFLLFIVWMVETPPILRYGVTGSVALLIVAKAVSSGLYKKRLDRLHQKQVREHASDRGQDDPL